MTIAEQLRHEGYTKGIHAGIEQGKVEGEYAARLNVARNMLTNHFDHETIKKVTGLSGLELSKLRT